MKRKFADKILPEDNIIQYCRKALGNDYRNMWIDPVYFDDKYLRYTDEFFSEVGIRLYPKRTNIRLKLIELGVSAPKLLSKCKSQAEKEKVKAEWDKYRSLVWSIIHDDINFAKQHGVKPVNIIVKGVRFSTKNKTFLEKITLVRKVEKIMG